MMTPKEQEIIRELRVKLYSISEALGQRADEIIIGATGMGDPVAPPAPGSLTSILNQITAGLANASAAVRASINQYYDARTAVAQAQAANAAGVPVAQYTDAASARNLAASIISPGTGLSNTFLGIPVWAIFGAAALYLVTRK